MKKEPGVCLLLLFALSACSNNDNNVQFRALDEGLKRYRNVIKGNISSVDNELKQKLQDPQTVTKAKVCQPKVAYVKELADSMAGYIDSLRQALKKEAGITGDSATEATENNRDAVAALFDKQEQAGALYHRLTDFNEKTVSVLNPREFEDNPLMKIDMEKARQDFRNHFPFRQESQVAAYFSHTNTRGALTMLDKIQNDVFIAANDVSNYCNAQAVHYTDSYQSFFPLVTQSSNYLRMGELLEISAGIGAFSLASRPRISINGKRVELNDDGVAVYTIQTAAKPGKYAVPVKVSFIKPDGSEASYLKEVRYTVEQ